ncbi:unnamed protein product [Chironomus riparius]|uniref:CWF19-like protein 1 n=1 Tax=Chironomus riparius TaxID=315576 RepID=A0A9N9WPV1_9DIPT|nr:unnamed protein product [Chironomus riparius]
MTEKLKVLVCGDIESNFDVIFDKVRNLNKKTPFAFLLCVGNFFTDGNYEALEKYKSGIKNIPIPTYILGPNSKAQEEIYNKLNINETNNEICPNLNYLGRKGVYTLSSKFTLAYLSGKQVPEGEDKEPWQFDKKDVLAVRNAALKNFSNIDDYRGIDFLLTSQWADGITESEEKDTSKLVSFLSLNVKPRYHFCALNDKHFEKLPFRLPAVNIRSIEPVSRFISLAKVNNPAKSKFLYAMNIQPLIEMRLTELMMKSTDEIECPYISMDFSTVIGEEKESSNAQFFWGSPSDNNEQNRRRQRNDQQQNKRFKPMIDQDKCWFCLQSPDIDKHLIISIGEHFYLALAKSPVNDYHVLIIPISHIQAVSHLTDELFQELDIFKKSIKKFYESLNMVAVFFERNYLTSHSIVNAVPISHDLEWQLPETLKDKAEEFSLSFETIPKITSPKDLPEKGAYFIVEFGQETQITRSMKHFPINFGRDFVCAEPLLNCESKVDWKNCKLPVHIEEDLVTKFKEAYKPFDFNDKEDDSD